MDRSEGSTEHGHGSTSQRSSALHNMVDFSCTMLSPDCSEQTAAVRNTKQSSRRGLKEKQEVRKDTVKQTTLFVLELDTDSEALSPADHQDRITEQL